MLPDLIKESFRKTGLYPFNRNVFTKEDFAPSKVTSTVAHTPDDYPDNIPSSDTAVMTSDEDTDDGDTPSTIVCGKKRTILDLELSDLEENDCTGWNNDSDNDFNPMVDNDNSHGSSVDDHHKSDEGTGDSDDDLEKELDACAETLRYDTRHSSPTLFKDADKLIHECYKEMASFTAISDAAKSTEELINEVYALRRQVPILTAQ
ncbi:hypothetical protein BDQ17DRAFT_1441565 [Cyathus striatus]|nr:hypothetical protein BDQ17DRAFT_1441565 [Cyathus striatus]